MGVELGGLDVYPPLPRIELRYRLGAMASQTLFNCGRKTSVESARALRGGSTVLESGGSRERQQNDAPGHRPPPLKRLPTSSV